MVCGLHLSFALDTNLGRKKSKLVFVSDTQTKPQRLLLLSNLYVSGEPFLALSASLALLSFAFEIDVSCRITSVGFSQEAVCVSDCSTVFPLPLIVYRGISNMVYIF